MCDQSIFRNACLFPMSKDQLYIHVHLSVIYNPCVTRFTNIFYSVILTPKQTIRIIINSLPIIIEKDINYNAISTVSNEYFFSHSADGKAHSVIVSESSRMANILISHP